MYNYIAMIISEAKFHIAISFCICILINVGGNVLTGALSINMKYAWWSENCLIRIPGVDSSINSLIWQHSCQSVPFREENLVGGVILVKKLNPVKVS